MLGRADEAAPVYEAAIDRTGLPAHTIDLGAKGCVSYRPTPLTNYRDFLDTLPELFAGRGQLAVYHLMFDPEWTAACKSCCVAARLLIQACSSSENVASTRPRSRASCTC